MAQWRSRMAVALVMAALCLWPAAADNEPISTNCQLTTAENKKFDIGILQHVCVRAGVGFCGAGKASPGCPGEWQGC